MSTEEDHDDDQQYRVVVNHEEQYSIWPVGLEIPSGWKAEGQEGSKQACLDHIERVWTDMRPLSLRKKLEELQRLPPPDVQEEPPEDSLVDRLCTGEHKVSLKVRDSDTLANVQDGFRAGYVHVHFLETRGGTLLGLSLDPEAELPEQGGIRVVGTVRLNFQPIRVHARVDRRSLEGIATVSRIPE